MQCFIMFSTKAMREYALAFIAEGNGSVVTLGRVLDTVSVSANHPIKNETAGSKTLLGSAKKESPRLKIQ